MQTEKLPTTPPSGPSKPDSPQPEVPIRNTPAEQIAQSDRVFWWCFIPAVVIFALVCLWLNYADIYGTARTQEQQHRIKVQVYRPPVKHPKKKPPPPPKPPKIKPPPPRKIVHLRTPPKIVPRVVPHPPPPAPRAPSVGHPVHNNNAIPVGPVSPAPVAVPQTPGTDVRPQAPVVAPPAPPPPVIEKPTPPAPVVKAPPAPPAPAPKPTPPKPAPKPQGYVDIDHQEASVDEGSIPQVDTSNVSDSSTITGPCVVSFEIDTNGHISGAHVKKSSGNADYDDDCLKAIRQSHGKPGVQDHILYRASATWTFSAG